MDTENELQQLKIDKDNPIGESSPDSDLEIIAKFNSSTKAKKEEKKRKKKEKANPLTRKLNSIIGDIDNPGLDDDELSLTQLAKSIKKNTAKKGKGISFDTDGFMDSDGSTRKKKKDVLKKFEEQYKDEKALLQALLKEANGDAATIKKVLHELLGKTVRGMSKTTTDLASTLVSANGNRLQIIKAQIDLKNKINDLVNKEESRQKGDDGGALDQDLFGSQMMQNLFSQGNKEFINTLQTTSAVSEEEFEAYKKQASRQPIEFVPVQGTIEETNEKPPVENYELPPTAKPLPVTQPDFDPDLADNLTALNEELKDDPIYGRSVAGDRLIEHEADGVVIKIKRWTDSITGDSEYEFVAINKFGDEVIDYEVPNKKKVMPIKFNDDTNTASDNFGRTYSVIDVGEL